MSPHHRGKREKKEKKEKDGGDGKGTRGVPQPQRGKNTQVANASTRPPPPPTSPPPASPLPPSLPGGMCALKTASTDLSLGGIVVTANYPPRPVRCKRQAN